MKAQLIVKDYGVVKDCVLKNVDVILEGNILFSSIIYWKVLPVNGAQNVKIAQTGLNAGHKNNCRVV